MIKRRRTYIIGVVIITCVILIILYTIWNKQVDKEVIFNKIDGSPLLTVDLGNNVEMEFVLIDSGSFTMGSYEEVGEEDELPVHTVYITEPFYMGAYEVTQKQWETVMGYNPSSFNGNSLPVENVSYLDCVRFIQKVSKITGMKFSLPSEAMWEYACRASTSTKWFFGDEEQDINSYSWINSINDYKTHDVGLKLSNPWGLYDMYGNVQEWCLDWYESTYSIKNVVNPLGPDEGLSRVIRGGGWGAFANNARSGYRNAIGQDEKNDGIGFRCSIMTK